MKDAKFEDLLTEQLVDLYNAENQILTALPTMIAATSSQDLARAFQDHLAETKGQVTRLETVFEMVGLQPGAGQSEAMQALLDHGDRVISSWENSPALDAALIEAAQKVEHYEISGYRMARALAEVLGQQEAAELLQETMDEEIAADEILDDVAEIVLTGDIETDELDEEVEVDEIAEGA